MNVRKYLAAATISLYSIARGATIVVPVTQDTTLFEFSPTSNLGAAKLGAGAIAQLVLPAGTPARMRALMRFDLAEIPAGATITAAELQVTVVDHLPGGIPPGSTFELHRVLKDWGEGVQVNFNLGAPAVDGEATWVAPKHPGPAWTAPGASGADDAADKISSTVAINALGAYTFPSTSDLIADVQNWLANPASNFGWLMKSASENLQQTARRFGHREGTAGAATLTVTYTALATELRIEQFELRPAGMFLSWTGATAPYQVERAENVEGPWTTVTAALNETQTTVPADLPAAFYRVVSTTP
jgi:hypothetical protein